MPADQQDDSDSDDLPDEFNICDDDPAPSEGSGGSNLEVQKAAARRTGLGRKERLSKIQKMCAQKLKSGELDFGTFLQFEMMQNLHTTSAAVHQAITVHMQKIHRNRGRLSPRSTKTAGAIVAAGEQQTASSDLEARRQARREVRFNPILIRF